MRVNSARPILILLIPMLILLSVNVGADDTGSSSLITPEDVARMTATSLEELTKDSELIVFGKVMEVSELTALYFNGPEGISIFSSFKVAVENCLKGTIPTADQDTLTAYILRSESGDPFCKIGERVVLFLRTNGKWSDGLFLVFDSNRYIINEENKVNLFDKNKFETVTLDECIFRIKKYISVEKK